jgi:hypothetical protein
MDVQWQKPGIISHVQRNVFGTQQISLILNYTDDGIYVPLGIS